MASWSSPVVKLIGLVLIEPWLSQLLHLNVSSPFVALRVLPELVDASAPCVLNKMWCWLLLSCLHCSAAACEGAAVSS